MYKPSEYAIELVACKYLITKYIQNALHSANNQVIYSSSSIKVNHKCYITSKSFYIAILNLKNIYRVINKIERLKTEILLI